MRLFCKNKKNKSNKNNAQQDKVQDDKKALAIQVRAVYKKLPIEKLSQVNPEKFLAFKGKLEKVINTKTIPELKEILHKYNISSSNLTTKVKLIKAIFNSTAIYSIVPTTKLKDVLKAHQINVSKSASKTETIVKMVKLEKIYNKLTINELRVIIEKRGINFKSTHDKKELIALLKISLIFSS